MMIEPASSFKFAKLPDVVESKDEREEIDKSFLVPVPEANHDLNRSKFFMPGKSSENPNFRYI